MCPRYRDGAPRGVDVQVRSAETRPALRVSQERKRKGEGYRHEGKSIRMDRCALVAGMLLKLNRAEKWRASRSDRSAMLEGSAVRDGEGGCGGGRQRTNGRPFVSADVFQHGCIPLTGACLVCSKPEANSSARHFRAVLRRSLFRPSACKFVGIYPRGSADPRPAGRSLSLSLSFSLSAFASDSRDTKRAPQEEGWNPVLRVTQIRDK